MSFDRMTPVVHLGPVAQPLRYREKRDRVWVLWPAFAYHAVVPMPRERPFNLFQEYLIKLCRAGVRTAGELGTRLGLGAELAAFILLELQQMGMLDGDGAPTERACKELESAEAAPGEAVAGHVFQDPFTGTLWPRFAPGSLKGTGPDKVTKDEELQTLRFDLVVGSTGNPERLKATAVIPDRHLARSAPPSAQAILSACREHRRYEQNYLRACGRDARRGESDGRSTLDLPAFLQEVSLVSAIPQPVFLSTYLFVPEDETRVGHWQVCDPFGLGPSLSLRRQIDGVTAHEPEGLLARLVERVTARSYAVNPVDLSEDRAANQRRAAASVEADLGPAIRGYPELHRQLVDAEKALQEARVHSGRSGAGQREYLSRLKDFVARAYHSLEELCDLVLAQYPPGDGRPAAPGENADARDTLAALSAVAEENAELLAKIAARVGLDEGPSAAFATFFRMSRAQAKHIISHDGRRLQFQFGVMVATARDMPNHPVYRLAAEFPDCVPFLFELKRWRDGASHAGDVLMREDAAPVRSGVYRMVRGLLPEMARARPAPGMPGDEPGDGGAALNHQRLRARATMTIHRRLGQEVRGRRNLYTHLLDMQTRLEELRVTTGTDGQEDRELAAGGLLREGCSAVEAALQELDKSSQCMAGAVPPGRDKRENAARLLKAAEAIGFELDGGQLPESLVTVSADRLEKTLQFGTGTLNALAMALLWTAEGDPNHPFRAVARTRPSFLLEVGDLSARRGHGDRPRLLPGEAESVVRTILALVETVLIHSS